jgi:hypothetical protein
MVKRSHDFITRVMITSVIIPYDVLYACNQSLYLLSIMNNHTILKYDQMLIELV